MKESFIKLLLIIHLILILKTKWSYTENVLRKYLSFVIDAIFPADNSLQFRKNLLEEIQRAHR